MMGFVPVQHITSSVTSGALVGGQPFLGVPLVADAVMQ